jgi:enoyl-CoA hydratase/carnithine racemase
MSAAPNITAQQALAMGLVNRVVPDDRLTVETLGLAAAIAEKSPKALAVGKAAFQRQLDLPLDEAYRLLAAVMADNLMAQQTQDGIAALLDKRTPTFPIEP